jgi:hypothetical protein
VLAEQSKGITVISRRPPAFCRADVLGDIDASLNGGNERVLHAVQRNQIPAPHLVGFRLQSEDGDVIGNATEQPQHTNFVYHGLTMLAGDASGELPVRPADARKLVEIDLSRGRLPPDPADGIILEEEFALRRDTPGQFQRGMVEYQQVHTGRQEDVKRVRRSVAEVGCDVDVRIRTGAVP